MAKDKTLQLRKQVHKLFGDGQVYDDGYQSCYDGKWIDMTDEVCAVADFIIADRERVELEARIDELGHCCGGCGVWHSETCSISQRRLTFRERIAELKAQQEQLNDQQTTK